MISQCHSRHHCTAIRGAFSVAPCRAFCPIKPAKLFQPAECKHSPVSRFLLSLHRKTAYSILSLTYTIVSIQNTYVWIHPENRSQYTCNAAGIPILANHGIMPYHRPMMITPESRLAKRRSEIEIGFAISPIRLMGNRTGIGWNRLVKWPIPRFLIP